MFEDASGSLFNTFGSAYYLAGIRNWQGFQASVGKTIDYYASKSMSAGPGGYSEEAHELWQMNSDFEDKFHKLYYSAEEINRRDVGLKNDMTPFLLTIGMAQALAPTVWGAHSAHHSFMYFGEACHIQTNTYIRGISGSNFLTIRIPIPALFYKPLKWFLGN